MPTLETRLRMSQADKLAERLDNKNLSEAEAERLKTEFRNSFDPEAGRRSVDRAIEVGAVALPGAGTEIGADTDQFDSTHEIAELGNIKRGNTDIVGDLDRRQSEADEIQRNIHAAAAGPVDTVEQ